MLGRSSDALLLGISRVVGVENVVVDVDIKQSYETDMTGRFSGRSLCVVRPGSPDEVAAVMRLCFAAKASVVPQGGHTGLVGGGTPRDGEIVVSLARLNELGPLDMASAQMTVGAGARLEVVHETARRDSLDFPVDFSARSSATLGGMAATNAGGSLAARYGSMRSHVAGIEAVLADGRIVCHLRGLLKDNTGYDLAGLFVGSEGTLGIITRLRLQLVPRLPARTVALLAVNGLEDAVEVLKALRARASSLQAVDYFEYDGLVHVCRHLGLSRPFPAKYPVYLVVECASVKDPTADLECVSGLVEDAVVATDEAGRSKLWLYRDAHNEAIRSLGIPHKLDVSLPISFLAQFERDLRSMMTELAPAAHVILFGHLADGNVHVNIVEPSSRDDRVVEAVLGLVARYRGSISGEHGIGAAKVAWLPLSRTSTEIAVMRSVRQALDPAGILSPGRLLPETST